MILQLMSRDTMEGDFKLLIVHLLFSKRTGLMSLIPHNSLLVEREGTESPSLTVDRLD